MAGVLVGVQVATALLAVALSATFARSRSHELIEGTIRVRMDAVAAEVEARARFDPFGALTLPDRLGVDLGSRFPDPVSILDDAGTPLATFGAEGATPTLPAEAVAALEAGQIRVVQGGPQGSWAAAPLLAPDGLPAGALLVRPLDQTIDEEMEGTRAAFRTATLATSALAALLALVLGAVFTVALVRPLRRMTRRVERLGEGDFADRLPASSPDELGRLAAAINEMAARVEASVDSLRLTDRMRRELIANVGHDLRTPLSALSATLEEAERFASEGRPDDVAAALADARRQTHGATALVADLFELSQLDRPDGPALHTGPVPIGELVHDVAARHASAFTRAGVAFELDVPAGLPTLPADGGRLVRLLSNLLDNARRHTPPGGTVRLGASADAEAVTIDVTDTGVGIDDAALPLVFERYYRGESARTRGVEGSGLGLAIARAVAEAHGGTLDVTSTVGQGSTFRLRLPLAAAFDPET